MSTSLHDSNQLFRVTKGLINIFFTTSSGQSKYLHTINEGEIFFSLESLYNKNMLLHYKSGQVDSTFETISFEETTTEEVFKSVTLYENFIDIHKKDFVTLHTSEELFIALDFVCLHLYEKLEEYHNLQNKKDVKQLALRDQSDKAIVSDAILELASVLNEKKGLEYQTTSKDSLISTVTYICKKLEIEIDSIDEESIGEDDPIPDISRVLNVRMRKVALQNKWFDTENGILLGFKKDMTPVALVPLSTGQYEMIDVNTQHSIKINKTNAVELFKYAYMIYKPLPQRAITTKDIFAFVSFSNKKDFILLFLTGLMGGLIALVPPLVISKLYDDIIPSAQKTEIYPILMALVISAFGGAIFSLIRSLYVARIKTRIGTHLESAIFDRLINLPTSFFKKYATGDLALRANGIIRMQVVLSQTVLTAILGGIFSIFSFLLLFKYSMELALIALLLVVLSMSINIGLMFIIVHYERSLVKITGELSGLVLQLLTGIEKLKITNAKDRAFGKWVHMFTQKRLLKYKVDIIDNYLYVFNTVFPLLVSIVIFSVITYFFASNMKFTTGEFIAFNYAFGQFLTATLALSSAVVGVLNVKPIYERIKPILNEIPEIQSDKKNPKTLNGDIEIVNLSFHYDNSSKTVLDKINLNIKAGEFVAIVGSSGSGKSTLLRLLLGFEKPSGGNIFYSNQSLQDIKIRAVRSQLGVVLQDARVMAGDIFTNIIGATNKTVEDAWSAAKLAGLDKDIEAMPMDMHTIVSDGGGTLSGGQQQRLLIARALINNPKIIYFDEATSALDNTTQAIVTKSLDALHATRVVIAHRLSTIINADKIIVLEQGKIVQTGNYEELVNKEGFFRELALRQIV